MVIMTTVLSVTVITRGTSSIQKSYQRSGNRTKSSDRQWYRYGLNDGITTNSCGNSLKELRTDWKLLWNVFEICDFFHIFKIALLIFKLKSHGCNSFRIQCIKKTKYFFGHNSFSSVLLSIECSCDRQTRLFLDKRFSLCFKSVHL